MSRPRFLTDEDLRSSLIQAVRRLQSAINITRAIDQGLSGQPDTAVLEYAWQQRWLLISHDVNTLKAAAEQRLINRQGLHGVFLVPQNRPTRPVAENLVLIWEASEFEDWRDRIVYLPF